MNLPVSITGIVISGNRIGRKYDFPTANIIPEEDVSDLPCGVYYSIMTVDKAEYPSITNLGVRPTVSDDGSVCAETSVYDYDGDLYGKHIKVTLLAFRRGEQKFDSVDDLFSTVAEDWREGRRWHGI